MSFIFGRLGRNNVYTMNTKNFTQLLLCLAMFVWSGVASFAVNSTNEPATNIVVQQTAPTPAEQLFMIALSGAKEAGAEGYQFSKDKVVKAYTYAEREAPLVVTEFIRWHAYRSAMYIVLFLLITGMLFGFNRWFRKMEQHTDIKEEEAGAYDFFKWLTGIAAVGVLAVVIPIHVFQLTKILTAPRVFVIEYVVNALASR